MLFSGIVDCRDLKLTQVPTEYPPDTIELSVEKIVFIWEVFKVSF